jgi:hypothetical protein
MRDASFAIGIGKQAIVQIVEVQNGELMDGALPAAGQQRCPQEKAVDKMCPAAQEQFQLSFLVIGRVRPAS